MTEPSFTDGELCLESKKLNEKDLKAILLKLKCTPRDLRPRKHRRLEGFAAILAQLPPAKPVEVLDLSDNDTLGDAAMKHCLLIPESVKKLWLIKCGLACSGVSTVCEFMKTNKTILHLSLGMNNIGDVGAEHISEMLIVNQTLQTLCVSDGQLGVKGFSLLSNALEKSHILQQLMVGFSKDVGDSHLLALIPGLALNKGLRILDIQETRVTETGLTRILALLKQGNVYLTVIMMDKIPNIPSALKHEINWWLQFNACDRRVIHDKDSSPSDWFNSLVKCAASSVIDFSYELLRAKPDFSIYG